MTTLSTAARKALTQMQTADLFISRDRCSINGVTVARRVVDELLDVEAIVYSHRPNNFTRAYRPATEGSK